MLDRSEPSNRSEGSDLITGKFITAADHNKRVRRWGSMVQQQMKNTPK